MNKEIEEILKYFKNFDEGDNITITSDFLINSNIIANSFEQLQQENEELKEQLEINNQAFNFNVKTIKKHNKENNILTEFEKWLEEDIKNEIEHPIPEIYHDCERCKTIILDKLQELKEGKK